LKILQIVTQLEAGGAQKLASWLHKRLEQEESFTSNISFLYHKADFDAFFRADCLVQDRPRSVINLLRLFRRLKQLMKENEVVVAHTHYSIIACGLIKLTGLRTKVIAVHHSEVMVYPKIADHFIRALSLLGMFSENVYVAEHIRPKEGSGLVILNAVSLPQEKDRDSSRSHSKSDIDCLLVARLAKEKSISTAIEAMQFLPSRNLNIIGVGNEYAPLSKLVDDLDLRHRVKFSGQLSNDEVRHLMSLSRCILIPSRSEAGPLVVVEAVMSGANVVLSDIRAHKTHAAAEAVNFFSFGDPKSLAKVVESLENIPRNPNIESIEKLKEAHSETRIFNLWVNLLNKFSGIK
jgi:glycosyltransferase involved in cell wall biosynthesis